MFSERLMHFSKMRKTLPDRIIIFRDGLSESQFEMCKTLELPQVTQAIEQIYGSRTKKPDILLICAVKRHHARFFPKPINSRNTNIADKNGNAKPGTAVFE